MSATTCVRVTAQAAVVRCPLCALHQWVCVRVIQGAELTLSTTIAIITVNRPDLQSKEISQDQSKNTSSDIQKVTDKYVKMIDDVVTAKEKEIMTI
jgi:pyrimidine operon attenuation protein/uracil phosphoribosyltransferase